MSIAPPGRKGKLSGLGKLKLPKLKAKDVNKMDKKYEEEANKETLEGMDEKKFKKTWTKEFETKMLKRVNLCGCNILLWYSREHDFLCARDVPRGVLIFREEM